MKERNIYLKKREERERDRKKKNREILKKEGKWMWNSKSKKG